MKFRMLLAVMLLAGCATTQPQKLTDSDIALIMRVANLGQGRGGAPARSKTTDTAVRDCAVMMVTEHTAQNNKAESQLAIANVASSDTDLSRQLDAESGAVTDQLRPLSG